MTTDRPKTTDTSSRATRLAVGATALVAGVVLLGGCGSSSTTPTSNATVAASATTPAATSDPNPAPSSPQTSDETSDGTTGGEATAKGSTTGQATKAMELPRDAGDYGEALIAAWQAGDSAQIATLMAPAAAATLRSAKAPKDLIHAACEDNLCSWSTEAGARVTLTFDAKKVASGATHAVTAAKVAKA